MLDEKAVKELPESPGVYLLRDRDKNILYIGKAKNIRERAYNYIRGDTKDIKTQNLIRKVETVDTISTNNEKEAFLLENNLIKEHKPRYNINLKDDKTYISLKLNVQDDFPGLYITRKIEDDGSLYFGPYPGVKDVRRVLKIIQILYPVRRCKNTVFKKRKRPCILFQLGKCYAPCAGSVDRDTYKSLVNELLDFLHGRNEKILNRLKERIEEASKGWNFEEAKRLKERYTAIQGMLEKQTVHEHFGKNRDVWAFLEERGILKAILMNYRRGVLIGKRLFKEQVSTADVKEAIASFIFQYYSVSPVPDEIILSEEMDEINFLEKYLQEKNSFLRIYGPKAKDYRDFLSLALENLYEKEPVEAGQSFVKELHLKKLPLRIEIYDISHIHGKSPAGVMVVFNDFKPYKKGYRVFHIREAPSMDDMAMMGEVVRRRLMDRNITPLPELIVIDGGKAHLAAVRRIMNTLNLHIDAIAIAKGMKRKRMEDVVYLPLRKNPVIFSKNSLVLKEIVRMRDEAHRFAITSHRKRKKKEDLHMP
ncbi:MAG TPA: hypothetical protein DDW17_02655 [Deltaproteobacteria bacterium]|nr:hypothetical protein [Deltaproteobacteria bacterium]